MANFNFGNIREALEAGRRSESSIYKGPIVQSYGSTMLDYDLRDTILNSDRIIQQYGANNVFIWGQKWGSSSMKVAE